MPGFDEIAGLFPGFEFVWVDIEDEKSGVEDWDIENFPTLLIQRKELVLFFGHLLPQKAILRQMLEMFRGQSEPESRQYAHANPERAQWQAKYNYRNIATVNPH